ncbi:transcriptional regulator, MarR family [Solidesulfovibrio fructosivorans JJ]]|uniref:Transcriptional regulator, MarR family n=1 Tax=Solidesulfovibrio fructosivorans JJ] TaxID=596151 RepID=E1K0B1_SOLFR|nr:MarR family transcriptional regulator [Solidesulfovibrio fructosivorans]EFL49942.1 transcriptional regulator, MarR family [Solidesulfovibrio fructosivorans JJ]]
MSQATQIIDALVRFAERSDVFRHGREDFYGDMHLTEIHCIHWIGSLDHANVTGISREMGMTRGAISKIAKKLVGKGLIESYREPTNNKEIYFRLTGAGRRMFDVHGKCHAVARRERLALLTAYDAGEQDAILRFLRDINCHIDRKMAEAQAAPVADTCDAAARARKVDNDAL